MADNVGITPGSGAKAATREVTYSGETAQVQVVGLATFAGADDAKTVADIDATNPLPTYARDASATTSFGPITTASTVLFAAVDTADEQSIHVQLSGSWDGGIYLQFSNDNSVWFAARAQSVNHDLVMVDTINAPDQFVVPVIGRYFRAITSDDFTGTVSGAYVLRSARAPLTQIDARLVDLDPAFSMPVSGFDPAGNKRNLAVAPSGGVFPADGTVFTGTRNPATVGPILQIETTGYGSILLQLAGTFTGTVTFQVSNDGSTWASAVAWPVAGGAAPVNSATAVGQWVIPAAGRFFRAQMTTAGTGIPIAVAVLKNWSAWLPTSSPNIAANSSVNVAQFAGTAVVNAGVAGMLAVGGNIAEDTAATSNPLICGGVARTALPASTIIAGDAIRQTFSVSGQLITKQNAPGDLDFYANATVTTNTQTAIRGAQAAGIRQNVTSVTYQNTTSTATVLTIQDGSTTLVTFSVPASMTEPRQLIFPTPLRGTAATALNYTAGTLGANVLLNVTGFNSY